VCVCVCVERRVGKNTQNTVIMNITSFGETYMFVLINAKGTDIEEAFMFL